MTNHLTETEIQEIIEGEKIEFSSEKHFVSCSLCQSKVQQYKLINSIINDLKEENHYELSTIVRQKIKSVKKFRTICLYFVSIALIIISLISLFLMIVYMRNMIPVGFSDLEIFDPNSAAQILFIVICFFITYSIAKYFMRKKSFFLKL